MTKKDHFFALLTALREQKQMGLKGGIYHKIQIDLTYNSNHIEGSKLTHDQTRYIFETKTLGVTDKAVKVDDIVETVNHFRCIDLIIEGAHTKLTESFIKQLHFILKSGTTDSQKSWFRVGRERRRSRQNSPVNCFERVSEQLGCEGGTYKQLENEGNKKYFLRLGLDLKFKYSKNESINELYNKALEKGIEPKFYESFILSELNVIK
jgi:hypothetical protein